MGQHERRVRSYGDCRRGTGARRYRGCQHGLAPHEALEIVVEVLRRGIARGLRLLGHRLHDDGLEFAGYPRLDLTREGRSFRDVLVGDRDGCVRGERGTSRDHLIEHDSEGVDVASAVHTESLGLLGREVGGRSHHRGPSG